MRWEWRLPSVRIADLQAEVRTLTHERDEARRELERVIAQRDELRRVIGNVRSYARQEAQKVVENHAHFPPDLAATVKPDRVAMRPTVHLAAHLRDPEPVCTCLQDEPRTWASCPVHPPAGAGG